MPYFFDSYYLILVVPALLVALWAQANVKGTFNRYREIYNSRGLTGAEAARRILDQNGLYNVSVEHIKGSLSDHFDPSAGVIRLSDGVYGSTSIAAVGVAAHEAGHAVQYGEGYVPIKVRSAIIPVTNIGSQLSFPLIILGLVMSFEPLVLTGIVLFSTVTVFQLITLPVELDASRRALSILQSQYLLSDEELKGASKVLRAAALTYVAALIVAVAQLLRLILRYGRNSRR